MRNIKLVSSKKNILSFFLIISILIIVIFFIKNLSTNSLEDAIYKYKLLNMKEIYPPNHFGGRWGAAIGDQNQIIDLLNQLPLMNDSIQKRALLEKVRKTILMVSTEDATSIKLIPIPNDEAITVLINGKKIKITQVVWYLDPLYRAIIHAQKL